MPKQPTSQNGTATTASGVITARQVRRRIDADTQRAAEVVESALRVLHDDSRSGFLPDITGRPSAVARHAQDKRATDRGLQTVEDDPFFSCIDTIQTCRGSVGSIQLLVTRARNIEARVEGENWLLVSWTSHLATELQNALPGESVIIKIRNETRFDVVESSKYERLTPSVRNATFAFESGSFVVGSEDDLANMPDDGPAESTRKPRQYEATTDFGLHEIIVLADNPQRSAMSLPFVSSMIIEGPPGSGKTSIGLMRIAVLYDRQWEELELDRAVDSPFHSYETMRVLVHNPEIVSYLRELAKSIGVGNVRIDTTDQYFRNLCKAAGVPLGARRTDRPFLSRLKSRRSALIAVFTGFRMHVRALWEQRHANIRRELGRMAPDFEALADVFDGWVDRLLKSTLLDGRIQGDIQLSGRLSRTFDTVLSGRSATRLRRDNSDASRLAQTNIEDLQRRAPDAERILKDLIRDIFDRTGIMTAMFQQPEYLELLAEVQASGAVPRSVSDGDRMWKRQYKGDRPASSEHDLAMMAWLVSPILTAPTNQAADRFGAKLERITHLVLDEAQDLSPAHIEVLHSHLVKGGTMTLVGDLHQNLHPETGLTRWEDVRLDGLRHAAFGVNYRQTAELGMFVKALHAELFVEECPWSACPSITGLPPRVRRATNRAASVRNASEEILWWRQRISPNAGMSIAVLLDDEMAGGRSEQMRSQLEACLQELGSATRVTLDHEDLHSRGDNDIVVVGSVRRTKGLEYDLVVFLDLKRHWSKPVEEIDLRSRNVLYVAASRAKGGLSLIMGTPPKFLETFTEQGLCQSEPG